jgi:predicted Rdx family selenoprotein
MANIAITRCPVCSSIRSRSQEVATALKTDLGLNSRIEDGVEGEFTVYVDRVPVIQRTRETLPSIDEVEAAVRNAIPVSV